jgi:L-rhamnonate dehydratase
MSPYPDTTRNGPTWMGPGQAPFVVELETDDGLTGFALNSSGGRYSCDVIATHFRRFIEGASPFDIERIWDMMFRASLPYGQGGITFMAMSAVDLALWDLVGKLVGQPVYNLIGGKTKDELPCYVTVHFADTLEAMAAQGFIGCKLVSYWGSEAGKPGLGEIEQQVAAARRAFGPDAELMLECYQSMDRAYAVRVAHRLREYDVTWLEDPLLAGHACVQNREVRWAIRPTQLALGNLEFDYRAFQEMLAHGACDILQPEVQWVGGITAAKRIAAMAAPLAVPVIPHCSSVYSYHFAIANVGTPYAEFVATGDGKEIRPVFDALVNEPLPEGGRIRLSEEPGFGVELDREALAPFGELA